MERLAVGAQVWAERRPEAEALAAVNARMAQAYPQEPPIGRVTLYEDRKRIAELRADRVDEGVEEHLAALDLAIAAAWEAFYTCNPASMNRSQFLAAIGRLVETKAKLDGTFMKAQTEQVAGSIRDLVMLGMGAEQE
jgi:ParB-like chromosome segregation protein Spo0J